MLPVLGRTRPTAWTAASIFYLNLYSSTATGPRTHPDPGQPDVSYRCSSITRRTALRPAGRAPARRRRCKSEPASCGAWTAQELRVVPVQPAQQGTRACGSCRRIGSFNRIESSGGAPERARPRRLRHHHRLPQQRSTVLLRRPGHASSCRYRSASRPGIPRCPSAPTTTSGRVGYNFGQRRNRRQRLGGAGGFDGTHRPQRRLRPASSDAAVLAAAGSSSCIRVDPG